MERQYVPHAVTGKPVPVLFPEEQAAQQAERNRNPRVLVSGWKCWCGAAGTWKGDVWLLVGDNLNVSCPRGHVSLIRFIPETVS